MSGKNGNGKTGGVGAAQPGHMASGGNLVLEIDEKRKRSMDRARQSVKAHRDLAKIKVELNWGKK